MAYSQQKLKQRYNKGVKSKPLVPRDLVLRKVVGTAKNPTWGKLGPYSMVYGIHALEDPKDVRGTLGWG